MSSSSSFQKVAGGSLLIAGCCIGAGMLGLPLVTATAGFFPSVAAFILSWLFMLSTGMLLLEANLWFAREVKGINLMTLTQKTLGKKAEILVAILFSFLFYCLMVAYLGGGGALISEGLERLFSLHVDPYLGSLALVAVFGLVIFLGTRQVDLLNRFLMAGLGVSYAALVMSGAPCCAPSNLTHAAWGSAIFALPAMIISFGFHNLIPSLTEYLEGNERSLRIAVLVGSAIPLAIYLLWEGVILGILPPANNLQGSIDSGAMITTLLHNAVGDSYVVDLMRAFAFFALVTSFLAVALSFVDFLSDGLKVKKTGRGSLFLVSLVLLPPLVFAYIYPAIFLKALNYAGAFGAVILFGIIPILMVWQGRYSKGRTERPLVPGGKFTLLLLGGFALFIFFMQLTLEMGVI
jgi:tyrosine-specific transport protein